MAGMETRMAGMETRMAGMETRMAGMETRMAGMETRMAGMETRPTREARMSIEYRATICPYCSCGCGIYLVVKDGKIIGQEPWKAHPVNEGKNCPKG